jgi:branched-chain amino acid transport system ATP-binding protein
MLAVEDLHAFYGPSHVLQGVSLAVPRGEIAGLLGRNGVGKSTTLKAIMGIVPPGNGALTLEGRSLKGLRPFEIARLGVAYVPEDRRILSRLTVRENLELGCRSEPHVDRGAREARLQRVFAYFPALAARTRQLGGTLSGGEQQMLAIGRGLMGNARLMLLDEPTEGLAPLMVAHLAETLVQINRDGLTVLLVEQNAKIALEVAHRAYVMEKGRVVFAGTPDAVRSSAEALLRLGV